MRRWHALLASRQTIAPKRKAKKGHRATGSRPNWWSEVEEEEELLLAIWGMML